MQLPTILGHEVCGIVEDVGSQVHSLKVGDRVSVESHQPCGSCYTCHRGWSHVCPNTRYPGVDFDGGFAPLVKLPERILWKVADEISDSSAAMMEPFGIAVHASTEGCGVSGLSVIVCGCGPIGLMNVAAAKALGATCVIAVDVNDYRLDAASKMGADVTINTSLNELKESLPSRFAKRGIDVAIDYSGSPSALAGLSDVLTPGGELRLLGVPPTGCDLSLDKWVMKGLIVRGLHGRRLFETWERATELLVDRKVSLDGLVSHDLPLKDAQHGFDLALKGQALKILLRPDLR
tara:strand:- start:5259 stop:6134 length:876 start_codon:yes stop_codon:yes gene_type:complete